MKKFVIQSIALVVFILVALSVTYNKNIMETFLANTSGPSTKQLRINQAVVTVEIADSSKERGVGLSGRDLLPQNSGLLMVFPEEKKHQIWMKGMKFPLDLIFIRDGKVIDVLKNIPNPTKTQPDSTLPIYQPVEPAGMLLEANSGFVEENNISVGDMVSLEP